MKGTENKFIHFLLGFQKRFIIPVYQRKYSWKIDHCRQLYDDLVKTIRFDRPNHFFGSMVSFQGPEEGKDDYLIIDGQQRITTVSLLILAMYKQILAGQVSPKDEILSTKLYDEYLVDKYVTEKQCVKLQLIKEDQEAFLKLFGDKSGYIRSSNLTINFEYFLDRIVHQEIDIDALYEAISRLEIIDIILKEGDNPQLIFESLNSTGLALSEGDKIRNYLLMNQTPSKQAHYYDNYWKEIEIATLDDKGINLMFRDYLSIKQQRIPRLEDVYFRFRDYHESIVREDEDHESQFKEILRYAKWFGYLLDASSPWDELNKIIYRLNRLRVVVARPFMLEVLRIEEEGLIDSEKVIQTFAIIESYVYRRYICDVPTNALNKIFLSLNREIERFDGTLNNYVEKLKYALSRKRGSGRFPDNIEFKEVLSTKNVYNLRGEGKQYLFERLENYDTLETKDVWAHLEKGTYSIEHIMPQTLSKEWEDALGDDYDRIHNTWLHRLANLTLTAYNTKYSNNVFGQKRDMKNGFRVSGLRINQWIGEQEKWEEVELEQRSSILTEQALEIWPPFLTDYLPPEVPLNLVSLADEDYKFTGTVLEKYSFMGKERTVESWADMYQQVLKQLHDMDRTVLSSMSFDYYQDAETASHFSTSETAFRISRMIDESIYVRVSTSTKSKIRMLRKLFLLFDVDLDELVFYLQNDNDRKKPVSNIGALRLAYWKSVLPKLHELTEIFENANAVPYSTVRGILGMTGVRIKLVSNFESARVELALENPDKDVNKKLFDYLYRRKDEIESQSRNAFIWSRQDDVKRSRIYLELPDVGIMHESDWPKVGKFQVEGAKVLLDAFSDELEEFSMVGESGA